MGLLAALLPGVLSMLHMGLGEGPPEALVWPPPAAPGMSMVEDAGEIAIAWWLETLLRYVLDVLLPPARS